MPIPIRSTAGDIKAKNGNVTLTRPCQVSRSRRGELRGLFGQAHVQGSNILFWDSKTSCLCGSHEAIANGTVSRLPATRTVRPTNGGNESVGGARNIATMTDGIAILVVYD